MLGEILLFLGCGFLVWYMVRIIKTHPELFTKDNLNKSFSSMGVLALILIAVVGLSIILLRHYH